MRSRGRGASIPKVAVRADPADTARPGHVEKEGVETRKPVESHVKVHVGKGVAGELTRPGYLSQESPRGVPAAGSRRGKLPEKACSEIRRSAIDEPGTIVPRKDRRPHDRIQVTADREIRVLSNQVVEPRAWEKLTFAERLRTVPKSTHSSIARVIPSVNP